MPRDATAVLCRGREVAREAMAAAARRPDRPDVHVPVARIPLRIGEPRAIVRKIEVGNPLVEKRDSVVGKHLRIAGRQTPRALLSGQDAGRCQRDRERHDRPPMPPEELTHSRSMKTPGTGARPHRLRSTSTRTYGHDSPPAHVAGCARSALGPEGTKTSPSLCIEGRGPPI